MKLATAILIPLVTLSAQTAQKNPFEPVPSAVEPAASRGSGPPIRAIEFRGLNRLPPSALRAVILSRTGDPYNVETLQNDAQALYRTRRFWHVVWETEPGPAGPVVRFVLVERPLIESIEYDGDATITIDQIRERLDQRKVNLKVETLLDLNDIPRAALAVQELLAERGRQDLTVVPLVERIGTPANARITFKVAARPEK